MLLKRCVALKLLVVKSRLSRIFLLDQFVWLVHMKYFTISNHYDLDSTCRCSCRERTIRTKINPLLSCSSWIEPIKHLPMVTGNAEIVIYKRVSSLIRTITVKTDQSYIKPKKNKSTVATHISTAYDDELCGKLPTSGRSWLASKRNEVKSCATTAQGKWTTSKTKKIKIKI